MKHNKIVFVKNLERAATYYFCYAAHPNTTREISTVMLQCARAIFCLSRGCSWEQVVLGQCGSRCGDILDWEQKTKTSAPEVLHTIDTILTQSISRATKTARVVARLDQRG